MQLDDLLNSSEVAEIVGLSRRESVTVYRKRYPDFPKPVSKKGRAFLWLRADVLVWAFSNPHTRM